ncbi:MAG: DNA translocase FtsK 4TM domain-containing protein [Nitrospiraceae bacterium]
MGAPSTGKRADPRKSPTQRSSHRQEIVAVLCVTLGVLLLLSFLSYVPQDRTPNLATSAATASRNWIGSVGATLAAWAFGVMGGAAYAVPLAFFHVALRCFTQDEPSVPIKTALYSLGTLTALSGLLHLEVVGVPTLSSGFVQRGQAGGWVGHALAETLRAYFANTGAHILLFSGLLVSLLLSTSLSLADLGMRLREWGEWLREASEAIREWVDERLQAKATKPERTKAKPTAPRSRKAVESVVEEALPEDDESMPVDWPLEAQSARGSRSASVQEDDDLADGPRIRPVREPVIVAKPPLPTAPTVADTFEPIKSTTPTATNYVLPDPQALLDDPSEVVARMSDQELKAQSEILSKALASFGIDGRVTEVHPGPVVTMYEFEPAPGVKVARIVNLADDLALAMKAMSMRIVAPLPGKSVVGIEVPNRQRETVSFKEVVMSDAFRRSRSKLMFALGKDIFGVPTTADLRTMPHVLVAGATGAGKSVSLNTMLLSLLFNARPDEVKLLLIDPKMLELQVYDGIPHLLRPVITDPKSATRGLGWVVQEMERRYKLLSEAGVRNIEGYNRWVGKEQGVVPPDAAAPGQQPDLPIEFLPEEERLSAGEQADGTVIAPRLIPKTPPEPLPFIVVMIDELADLMMVAPKDMEDKIARLAQMARAAGIHLVLATQRPSVDVLTGLIKANFPARVAFQVASKVDSRTILDANGAEALLGRGDMLYSASGTGRTMRIHGAFLSDEEVRRVVAFVKKQANPVYNQDELLTKQEEAAEEEARDEVYEQAKELVLSTGQASASLIQRRLRVGYPRAARMIEQMEQDGIVGAAGRDGRREVLGRRGPVGQAYGE